MFSQNPTTGTEFPPLLSGASRSVRTFLPFRLKNGAVLLSMHLYFGNGVDKIPNRTYIIQYPIWDFVFLQGGSLMDEEIRALNMELSQMYKKENELYHRYSVFSGLSDPASWVLYTLYEEESRTYTQNDLVSMWSFPKQTINYTVSKLAGNGWVSLKQLPGGRNRKAILLTEEGRRTCEEKVLPLMLAEEQSLKRLTETERNMLLQLIQKQYACFEDEIKKIIGEKS